MHIERKECHICGAQSFSGFTKLDHRHIARCNICGYMFASKFDEVVLMQAYAKNYYASPEDQRLENWLSENTAVWEGLCNTLDRSGRKTNTLLDIGSGTGGFLLEYHRRNPNVILAAIESSAAARGFLQNKLQCISFPANDAMKLSDIVERYDVITLLQTLEHCYEPAKLCGYIYDHLNPGGLFFLTVPNARSYRTFFLMKKEVYCFGNCTHLQFFTNVSLNSLLKNAGFSKITRVVEYGGSNIKGPGKLVQWLLRKFCLSSELRYIAIKES